MCKDVTQLPVSSVLLLSLKVFSSLGIRFPISQVLKLPLLMPEEGGAGQGWGFCCLEDFGGLVQQFEGREGGGRAESQEGHAGLSTGQWPSRNKQRVQSSSAEC